MTNVDVDRWIPNYRELGYTRDQAEDIAAYAQSMQDAGDTRDWTEILADAVDEIDCLDVALNTTAEVR